MFRYRVLIWNIRDPQACAAARAMRARPASPDAPWRTPLNCDGVEVRCAGEQRGLNVARALAGSRGVVLGVLFRSGESAASEAAEDEFDESESRAIDLWGTRLIERYWGRYVAVVRDPDSGDVSVLRDPSAGLPCYTLRINNVDVYCSRIEDALALAAQPLYPDWSYVAACLCLIREHSARTGLEGVSQLVGGECARHHDGSVTRRHVWDPLELAVSRPLEDPQAAAAALGRCTRDVVRAWGSCFDHVLVSLSGGLDSSILIACLAPQPAPRVRSYHYFPVHTDLDERRFARLAAERAGVQLIERARPLGFDLAALGRIAPSAEPTNYPFYLEHSRREAELAAEYGADALFIGYGGDQLFYQERAEWAPEDFLHRRGMHPGLARVLFDSAQMDQLSVWRILRQTLHAVFGGRRWSLLHEGGRARPLLACGVVSTAVREASCLHPLVHGHADIPSGKRWHAHQVLAPFEFYDPFAVAGDPQRLAPLCSQPLMELCLRIPVDVLTTGGWDRAIARRAFHDALPPQILNRRNKGGIEAHVRFAVERNRALLRDLLLDGELVRAGLIVRSGLERALAGRAEIETQSGELLEYACLEAWLRCWREQDSSRMPNIWQTVP